MGPFQSSVKASAYEDVSVAITEGQGNLVIPKQRAFLYIRRMQNLTGLLFRRGGILLAFVLFSHALEAQAPRDTTSLPASGTSPLRIGDVLNIKVWPDSSMGGQFTIEETGLIYLPAIGEYRAAGMLISDVRKQLRDLYSRELKFPVVNVTPSFRVTVLGAVLRPGLYYSEPTSTWFDVISDAGGFAPGARQDDVRIIRNGRMIRVNGSQDDVKTLSRLNVAVESGDRIMVPERRAIWAPAMTILQTALVIYTAVWQLTR